MGYQELASKYETLFQICSKLLQLKNQGKTIGEYLERKGVEKVGIWGCADLGQRVCEELADSKITIVCGIDKLFEERDIGAPVLAPVAENKDVINSCDLIILTPVFDLTEIVNLSDKWGITAPLCTLDKILMEM